MMAERSSAYGSAPTRIASMPSRLSVIGVAGAAKLSSNERRSAAATPKIRSAPVRVAFELMTAPRLQFRQAQCDQCVAPETTAEEQQAGGILPLEQHQRLSQFAMGSFRISRAPRHETQVQSRHREARIEINSRPIILQRTLAIPRTFAAQREHVVHPRIQLIIFE